MTAQQPDQQLLTQVNFAADNAPEKKNLSKRSATAPLSFVALSSLFFSCFGLEAQAQSPITLEAPPAIEADELNFDQQKGRTEAHGNVIVTVINNAQPATLATDHLIFEGETIQASGNILIKGAEGDSIQAQEATLSQDLSRGTLTTAQLNFTNGASLRAEHAIYAQGDKTELHDARYTACTLCENGDPQWQIRSATTVHDDTTQTISSWHNRVEVAGVPVLYIPYLAHPSPSVRKRSGFLAPQMGNDGRLGAFVTTPYFFNLASNYDLTMRPQFTRDEGVVLAADWRHLTPNGRYNVSLYGNNPQDELATIDGDHSFRGGIMGKGAFALGDTDLSFSIQEMTDDLFFDRYRINDATTFANKLKLSHHYDSGNGAGSVRVDLSQYRHLNDAPSATRVHDIAPHIQHTHQFNTPFMGGKFSWVNSFKHSRRDFGLNLSELSSALQWLRQYTAQNGTVWTLTNHTEFNNFSYGLDAGQTRPANSDDDSYISNVTALNAEYPLIRFGTLATQRITPRLQIVGVAADQNLRTQYLRSDVARDLSATDLFTLNAAGSELSRINMGIAYALTHRSGLNAEFFVGQSFNLSSQDYALSSGYGDHESNIVTEAQMSYHGLSATNTLRFDQSTGDILRHRSALRLDTQFASVEAQYNFYEQGQIGNALEEINIEGELKLTRHWFLRGKRHENLETSEIVREYAGLSYRDECTDVELRYSKDNTQIGDVPPSSSVMLFVNLKTLGGISR